MKFLKHIFLIALASATALSASAQVNAPGGDNFQVTNAIYGGTNYIGTGTNGNQAGLTLSLANEDEVGLVLQVQGVNTTNATAVVFTLIRSGDPNAPNASTFETAPPYSISVTQNGTNLVTVVTNLDHNFTRAARYVKLSVTNSGAPALPATNINAYLVKKHIVRPPFVQ